MDQKDGCFMKSVLFALVSLVASSGFAVVQLPPLKSIPELTAPVTVSEKEVTLNVDISKNNMKMSYATYGISVVRILVPELANVTKLNHHRAADGSPSVATHGPSSIDKVLQDNPQVEQIKFKITLQRHAQQDVENNILVCNVYVIENVEAHIRGRVFSTDQYALIDKHQLADCR